MVLHVKHKSSDRESLVQYTVKINNLSTHVTESELRDICKGFETVSSVKVNPGYAYINFLDNEDAQNATDYLNGLDLWGSKIKAKLVDQNTTNNYPFVHQSVSTTPTPAPHSSIYIPDTPSHTPSAHPSSKIKPKLVHQNTTKYYPFVHHLVGISPTPIPHSSPYKPPTPPYYGYQPNSPHKQHTSTHSSISSTVKISIFGDGLTTADLVGYFSKFGIIEGTPAIIQGSPNYAYINYHSESKHQMLVGRRK